ncbi:MAG: hypothetical protein WCQ95_10095 [Bacteroidota bacterium]
MRTKKIIVTTIILFIVLLPLIMWTIWLLTPKKPFKILIVDKTVLNQYAREHRGLNYLLKNNKYSKPDGNFYQVKSDYYGFFPLENKQYEIHDLSKFTEPQLDSMADYYDAVYYADSYGMYYNEWYRDTLQQEHSEKIYGGLDAQDLMIIKKMKARKKLIVTEFNFFASPTPYGIRRDLETTFNLKWTGWTGRYFDILDTLKNPELPHWVVRLYREQHNYQWPFTKSGIVFAHEDSRVEVLENGRDLDLEVPYIKSFYSSTQKYGIPDVLYYPYWFEITYSTDTSNHVFSYYQLMPNSRGDSILQHQGIPKLFPAAFEHTQDYKFFYFGGDFVDYPANFNFVQLKGIYYFHLFLLGKPTPNETDHFYYRYYTPLVETILDDYYKSMKNGK